VHYIAEGHEWFKAELDLYLWEIAGKYKVKIEMVDLAGNELDPPYEEEVDGWFGGVLRMLEALWEFICAVVSAIADAVMKALSFIIDLIVTIVRAMIDAVVEPVLEMIDGWTKGLVSLAEEVLEEHSDPFALLNPDKTHGMFTDMIYSGNFFNFLLALFVGLQVAGTFFTVMTAGMSKVAASLTEKLVVYALTIIIGLLNGAVTVLFLKLIDYFFSFLPQSAPFWTEGRGLSVLGFANAAYKANVVGTNAIGDIQALARAWAGFAIVGFLAHAFEGISLETTFALKLIGLTLAGMAFVKVLKRDVGDLNPMNPFSEIEEIFVAIVILFSLASCAKTGADLLAGG
jgi:hypothetical protein